MRLIKGDAPPVAQDAFRSNLPTCSANISNHEAIHEE
jgi:hypothetical protein